MEQFVDPRQSPVGLFSNLETAETALDTLQNAGFSADHLSLVPQSLEPDPAVKDTELVESAKPGAIAGSLFGAIGGLLLSFLGSAGSGVPTGLSLENTIGLVLIGSGLGAVAGGLLAAMAGANVPKAEVEHSDATHHYLILAEGTSDRISQAKEILRQHGSQM
jgi:hypothetical protein